MMHHRTWLLAMTLSFSLASALPAQRLEVPRRHDRPPGPPLSPEEAVAKMTVPEGFSVEIVAAEPDIMNPVAMCIDEKGRFWVTESFEYPRKEPGPGRDRIKVLEDTDGDGKVDKVTVFAEGLNIPSGIAVGHGGVWVANSPDILFLQDTDGDLKADTIETVVTGFGRTDTHELPNSLTWGPDGWLYGLNGVFNYSDVKYAEENPNYDADHPGWTFTCAMFRIHPRTREFQIFAEGTSNPWGIAINDEGDFFISACVIDHLWHIVESGYYIRQGGPYPPHTWPMRSIVDHKHQKAAYCGIEWFDSDAYPEEYRNVLYMGNIHGGCINADIAERSGSTYKGKPHPGFPAKHGAWKDDEYGTIARTGDPDDPKLADFLTANDAWFMPVVQKTGPDGCLYILDWYDRYHCYQDANADPEGIDRGKGRLYRVRYKDTPHAQPFDLAGKSDDELIALLGSANVYERWTAQRLLTERANPATLPKLDALLFKHRDSNDGDQWSRQDLPIKQRMHALWTRTSITEPDDAFMKKLARSYREPLYVAWYYRTASDIWRDLGPDAWHQKLKSMEVWDANYQTPLPYIIACGKRATAGQRINAVWMTSREDPHLNQVAWQNMKSALVESPQSWTSLLIREEDAEVVLTDRFEELLPRSLQVMTDADAVPGSEIGNVLNIVLNSHTVSPAVRARCVAVVCHAIRDGVLSPQRLTDVRKVVSGESRGVDKTPASLTDHAAFQGALQHQVTILRALWGEAEAQAELRKIFDTPKSNRTARLDALKTLMASGDESVLTSVDQVLASPETDSQLRADIIGSLGEIASPQVAEMLLRQFDALEAGFKPRAIEVLTQRPGWSIALLKAIKDEQVDKEALNLNQLKRIALFKNDELQKLLAETYGAIRQDRRSDRQHVINFHRDFLHGTPGDPERGQAAFKKVCGQCHKIYGEGAEVGPDITRNGRNDWNQLLQNVFDPSAVIGPGYQARTLVTEDGRVLTGLPVEESEQRIVLKIQGGKTETIPRDQIEAYAVSKMSMMPEDLEKQLTPQEIADLFAFLALDKPPGDPTGKLLPGAPQPKSR